MPQELLIAAAIDRLVSELKKDQTEGSYYYGWQANIAMAFQDTFVEKVEKSSAEDASNDIAQIANLAAKRFLEILCRSK